MHSQRKFNCVCPRLFTATMHSQQKFYYTAGQSFTVTCIPSEIYTADQAFVVTMHSQRKFNCVCPIVQRDDAL